MLNKLIIIVILLNMTCKNKQVKNKVVEPFESYGALDSTYVEDYKIIHGYIECSTKTIISDSATIEHVEFVRENETYIISNGKEINVKLNVVNLDRKHDMYYQIKVKKQDFANKELKFLKNGILQFYLIFKFKPKTERCVLGPSYLRKEVHISYFEKLPCY